MSTLSWILAFAGFAALIILHELGHFTAAKAVGMRVERFALFFPPLLFKVKKGETEYGVGAIPLGGYVRITGMNPNEELPEDVRPRAYYMQPVWKRIVVIGAGPAVNFVIAFVLLAAIFMIHGKAIDTTRVDSVQTTGAAAAVLKPGDRIVTVDGKTGNAELFRSRINTHKCAGGAKTDGCVGTTPVTLVVRRDGRLVTLKVPPRYDATAKRMLVGFGFGEYQKQSPGAAASLSGDTMWRVTKVTVTTIAELFKAEKRKEVSGVVGSYETTRQSFIASTTDALFVLALISLSLAIINLFPFLPLDGGHIFWALAEKVRGRAIPFAWVEKASVVGFMLVLFLFFIGLSNDIDRLRGDGFGVR
jgi:regulator of sigma E protease